MCVNASNRCFFKHKFNVFERAFTIGMKCYEFAVCQVGVIGLSADAVETHSVNRHSIKRSENTRSEHIANDLDFLE